MEDDKEVVELRRWLPLSHLYTLDNKPNYKLSSLTQSPMNSPSLTEFDEFIREMAMILTEQNERLKKEKMENVPVSRTLRKHVDNIGGFTNFAVGHHVKRAENGGNIKNLT